MQIGAATEAHRLLANGIAFHDLDHEDMRAACLGLSYVLLRPGLNTVIDWDHRWFWSWCGELFVGPRSTYFTTDEGELRQLFGLTCRAALAGVYRPSEEGWQEQADASRTMEPNLRELMHGAQTILSYLTFPLLEGLIKKASSSYVSSDGHVLTPYSVPRPGRPDRPYEQGATCSSVRDLLWLLLREVADVDLRSDLHDQRAHLATFAQAGEDGFDVIYRWRNSSLHGETTLTTVGGTVFNTAILVALSSIRDDYDVSRALALESVRWEARTPGSSAYRRSYYPPYL